MSDGNHLITALFERPAWTPDYPDYMRVGRMMRNQDAFAAGAAGELTVDAVVAQIAAKVAELCGHEEGGVEEPLSSFGLTSISVAELGTFIQTQFNHRVSALELMTTASALSLAQGIVHGTDVEDDRSEAETTGTGTLTPPSGRARAARRRPLPTARRTTFHAGTVSNRMPRQSVDRVCRDGKDTMPNALLVYPEHPPTYWGANFALEVTGIKAAFPPLGLLTVAAMFPSDYDLRVVDMNVSPLEDADLHWADMVFTSTMIVQRVSLQSRRRALQPGRRARGGRGAAPHHVSRRNRRRGPFRTG